VTVATKRQWATRAVLAALALLCAGAFAFQALGRADSGSSVPAPPALAASALPYLPSKVSQLSASDLAKDASVSSLPSTLDRLGYQSGSQRIFQGPSKQRLEYVQSRTLRFQTAAGARGFVSFVRDHAGAYVGFGPKLRLLRSGAREGTLIVAPLCACHMAQPALLAVVSAGRNVTWLEINGPGATRAALNALLARAP
jgi:hypothetical protein